MHFANDPPTVSALWLEFTYIVTINSRRRKRRVRSTQGTSRTTRSVRIIRAITPRRYGSPRRTAPFYDRTFIRHFEPLNVRRGISSLIYRDVSVGPLFLSFSYSLSTVRLLLHALLIPRIIRSWVPPQGSQNGSLARERASKDRSADSG